MTWLVGNRGMLGTELSLLFEREGVEFVGTDRDVSILDPAALSAFAEGKRIDGIVNCAAYTAVDKAEDEAELCRALNVDGPANLARLAKSHGAWMLHLSTDYVFDGAGSRPYLESDPVGPTGVYGRTKADGERAVIENCPESVVLRTAWLYGAHGPNFVSTMLRLMKERPSIGVVADQKGTPTWAADLARAILAIARSGRKRSGVYHFTNSGDTTWHGFATEIHRLGREYGILDRDCEVKPLRTDEYPTKARRPAYSILSKDKVKADYPVEVPDWKQSLSEYFSYTYRYLDDLRDFAAMAAYDLDTAQAMLDSARYLYVVYSCQQAVEKNLKVLASLFGSAPRIHNLTELADVAHAALDVAERSVLKQLTEYYLKGRYPRDFAALVARMDKGTAENLYGRTRELCSKLRRHPVFSTL